MNQKRKQKIKLSTIFNENFILISIGIYLVLSCLKLSPILFEGRFWAEEALIFNDFIDKKWYECIFHLFHNHIGFVQNIYIYISTLVNFKYAPLYTTYFSYLTQSISIIILVLYRKQLKISNLGILYIIIIYLTILQSAEVFANSTCLHFHFSLLASLILLLDIKKYSEKIIFRLLLMLCGLTGVPSNLFTPLYLIDYIKCKNKERLVQFLILFSTTLLQLYLLYSSGFSQSSRNFSFNVIVFILSCTTQCFISPVFSEFIFIQIDFVIRSALNYNFIGIEYSCIFCIPFMAFICYNLIKGDYIQKKIIFTALWILICSFILSLSSDDVKADLISYWLGGRYFFTPIILFFIVLLREKNAYYYIVLAFALATNIQNNHLTRLYYNHELWRDALNRSIIENSDTITVAPSRFKIIIPKKYKRDNGIIRR